MKRIITRFFAALSLVALTAVPSQASHLMGGELAYKCIGGMDYELTLVIYRDCSGIAVANSYTLEGLTANCGDTVMGDLMLVDTASIASGCSTMGTTCDGGTLPGMEVYYYIDTVSLPVNCDDWIFSVESCCRNAAITNLDNPGSLSFRFEARMNSLAAPCNDSPVFQELQMPFICDSVQFCLSNGVYDSDGDSLVYSMVDPIEGLNQNAPFLPGFSAADPFPTATGHIFDPITGNHCAIPTGLGSYVVAYQLDEYRNGQWIGSTRREVQLWVVPCATGALTFNGTVTDPNGNAITAGNVSLYEYGISSTTNMLVNTVALSATGTYAFPAVSNGQYIVRALPDSAAYPSLASTYHWSTHYWVYADVVSAVCDSTLVVDIQCVDQLNLSGSGYLEGYLGDLGLRAGFGVAWTDQEVVLETWPGRQHVRTVRSDSQGIYKFENVPMGNYRIVVDRPGSPMISYYSLQVLPNGSYTGLDYAGDENGIYTYVSTSVAELEALNIGMHPNPLANDRVLNISGLEDGNNSYTVINMAGSLLANGNVKSNGGFATLDLPNLSEGVYLLQFNGGKALRLVVE